VGERGAVPRGAVCFGSDGLGGRLRWSWAQGRPRAGLPPHGAGLGCVGRFAPARCWFGERGQVCTGLGSVGRFAPARCWFGERGQVCPCTVLVWGAWAGLPLHGAGLGSVAGSRAAVGSSRQMGLDDQLQGPSGLPSLDTPGDRLMFQV